MSFDWIPPVQFQAGLSDMDGRTVESDAGVLQYGGTVAAETPHHGTVTAGAPQHGTIDAGTLHHGTVTAGAPQLGTIAAGTPHVNLSKAEFDKLVKKKVVPSISHYCKDLRKKP